MTKTAAALGAGCTVVTVLAGGVAVAAHASSKPHAAAAGESHPAAPAPVAVPIVTAPPSQSTASTTIRQRTTAPAPVVSPTTVHLPKLHHLAAADAVVSVRHGASVKALKALSRSSGINAVAALDRGTVTLPTGKLRVLGVPLSVIRGFTPRVTAVSNPLWRSVARGELTVGYAAHQKKLRHRLGDTMTARGAHSTRVPLRIGAFATLDLGDAQGIVSNQRSASLGLAKSREVLVAAPKISLDSLRSDLTRSLGRHIHVSITRPEPVNQALASSYAVTTIPSSYLDLYRRAAVTCPGLPWEVLAGIGTVETGNGRNVHRSTAGAEGPMQFMPSTWSMYGMDADGDGKANIQDPVDAVFSAARYLCAAGAGHGGRSIDNAIFSYNHAWWYVREVLVIANHYA
jgi:hypothetical protein